MPHRSVPALLALGLLACAPTYVAEDRAEGDRAPLTRACDEVDDAFCLMPWPSNAFTVADPSTETGLRLEVDLSSVSGRDDPEVLRRADGFSRVSSVVTAFAGELDADSLDEASLMVLLAQPDHPDRGQAARVSFEVVEAVQRGGEVASAIVGHPLVPLEAGADYVVVVTDALRAADGSALEPSHATRAALGLDAARTQEEADLVGYHAPIRAFLAEQGVDPERVLRVWDFTTRSADDPRRRLLAMREAAIAAVDSGAATVVIDEVEHRDEGPVASVVLGHLAGMPNYLVDRELSVGPDGEPVADGTRDAPFRVVIPRGEGDYRMLMYGHGTGGTVEDAAFDEDIAAEGAAKVNIEFYQWTDLEVVDTFLDLRTLVHGASIAASGLVQAIADGAAIHHAMSGPIGDALAADELLGEPNPHAGRRPDDSIPLWVGGSLGGTMGLLYAATEPRVRYAVLNVAGAAWGTWTRDAYQFDLLQIYIEMGNGGPLQTAMMVSMAQTLLDEADGASYAERLTDDAVVALVQESLGDPVLPNAGTHVVAELLGATQVGAPLIELDALPNADRAIETSALTQFAVIDDDPLDRHGFTDRDGPAGQAARDQIFAFIRSVWDGEAVVTIPDGCPGGSCDFR